MDDRNEVLFSGPHLINNKPIIVKKWATNFDFSTEVMQTVPLWIKLPNLPLNCWSMSSLSRIGSCLGIPLYADKCTSCVARVSYARLLVEMDIIRGLPDSVTVPDPNGQAFEQAIEYDWVPAYCSICLQVGHKCQERKQPVAQPKQPVDQIKQGFKQNNIRRKQEWIVTWNVRGLNKVYKQKELRLFIRENNIVLIAILEHRVKENKAGQVIKKVAVGWDWRVNYSYCAKGRIWLFSNGLHTLGDRRSLWEDLLELQRVQQWPWLIMGDFNAILDVEDRQNGTPVQEIEIRDFKIFLWDAGLAEMKSIGRKLTWTNGAIFSKIDRALVNSVWMMGLSQLEVHVMDPGMSDHSPLCVIFDVDEYRGPRPFKFLNHLAEHSDFVPTVEATWNEPMNRKGMAGIWQKLKNLKQGLKLLNTREFGGIEVKMQTVRQQII
nr:uncharacterized protein LOC104088038 [Nicotiana tomentosiformis]